MCSTVVPSVHPEALLIVTSTVWSVSSVGSSVIAREMFLVVSPAVKVNVPEARV